MTKKEEIQQEIEKTQKQLAALQEKLKEAEDEVPEKFIFRENDEYCYVDSTGYIRWTSYTHVSPSDIDDIRTRNLRAFLSDKYAKIFAEKTQFIADMLYFKYLYDRDYEPDWNEDDDKWTVWIQHHLYENNKFEVYATSRSYDHEKVYFSTKEIAQKCAKWLNKKYGKE